LKGERSKGFCCWTGKEGDIGGCGGKKCPRNFVGVRSKEWDVNVLLMVHVAPEVAEM